MDFGFRVRDSVAVPAEFRALLEVVWLMEMNKMMCALEE